MKLVRCAKAAAEDPVAEAAAAEDPTEEEAAGGIIKATDIGTCVTML